MMSKSKDNDIYGDIVATKSNLNSANKVRSKIVRETQFKWVYVIKDGNKYNVSVKNAFDGKLTTKELAEVKDLLKNV